MSGLGSDFDIELVLTGPDLDSRRFHTFVSARQCDEAKKMKQDQAHGVIFDFDGVLVNSAEIAFQILAEIAERKGIPPLSREFLRNSKSEVIAKSLRLNPLEIFFYFSTNSQSLIVEQLRANKALAFFDEIRGSVHIFGKTKALRRLVRQSRLDPRKSFYIGDESRDVEAAKSVNLNSIAVTWGYHSKELLLSCEPNFCADSLAELHQILSQIH